MKDNKTIIIHSKVSYGYVGSNTTSLVLQTRGYDVVTVPTVLYSNHLEYPTVGGGMITEQMFADILQGILKLNILNEVLTVLTGFIGSVEQVKITAKFIKNLKQNNPNIKYICDPVMGDKGKGLYVPEDVPKAIIEYLVPLADILTPNQFEAEIIIDNSISSPDSIMQQLEKQLDLSRQEIIITGCEFNSKKDDFIYNCIFGKSTGRAIRAKKINVHPPGTGELFTAHTYLSLLQKKSMEQAVMLAGDILSATLQKMWSENRKEFELNDILFSMNILKQQFSYLDSEI